MKYKETNILDIDLAMKGKEELLKVKDNTPIDVKTEKALSPFDFVKDIRTHKHGDLLDKEENHKCWSTFMILRALSMKEDDVDVVNIINKYQTILSEKEIYYILCNLIEYDGSFYPYISTKPQPDNPAIEYVSKYYEISYNDAKDYIDVMGSEWANSIKSLYDTGVITSKGTK